MPRNSWLTQNRLFVLYDYICFGIFVLICFAYFGVVCFEEGGKHEIRWKVE